MMLIIFHVMGNDRLLLHRSKLITITIKASEKYIQDELLETVQFLRPSQLRVIVVKLHSNIRTEHLSNVATNC